MSATAVNIVNIALRSLGVKRITTISDDVESARVMTDLYEFMRDQIMESHPWNFAEVWSDALAANATAPEFDYTYSYALPADCLRVIEMEDEEDEFKVVGGNLFTDTVAPKIKYISLITTTGSFSKSFVIVLAARLAAEAAYALTNSNAVSKQKWEEYFMKLQAAKTTDGQEGTFEKQEFSSWLTDRG